MARFRDTELADVRLRGRRLELRRWQPDDAERVEAVMRDPSMTEFLSVPFPYTRADAEDFVTGFGHEGRDDGTGVGSAVVEIDSGRVVGAAALRLTGDPDIGYWIAPDARGHGYAAEVTGLLAAFGFGLGLSRIRVDCAVTNVASAASALAAGFRFEGVARDGVLAPARDGRAERRGDIASFGRLAGDPDDPIPSAFPRLPAGGLSDGVLALRTTAASDADALVATDDTESVRWSFTGAPRGAEQTRTVAARAGLDWLLGTTARMTMVDVATGRVAGELNVRSAGPPQVGGIGYGVHPEFRGRGYTTRALRLVAAWAFDTVGLARLELGAKTGNVASQRAAANAGWTPDGIREQRLRNADGSFSDEVRFALLNPGVRRARSGVAEA